MASSCPLPSCLATRKLQWQLHPQREKFVTPAVSCRSHLGYSPVLALATSAVPTFFSLGESLVGSCSGSAWKSWRSWSRRGERSSASVKPEAETEDDVGDSKAVSEEQQDGKPLLSSPDLEKGLSKAVRKTAATFAPRASSARSKNPATPGSTLYTVFEVQAYVSMVLGGVLSFNLLFPSDQPDVWRLMGMWSVWMFTIPSLRARDCSSKEKDALNYLFLVVPLINVTLPLVWKSFAAVWSADVVAFLAMYAWKLEWLGGSEEANKS